MCFFDYTLTDTLEAKNTVSQRPESLIYPLYTLSKMTSISNHFICDAPNPGKKFTLKMAFKNVS